MPYKTQESGGALNQLLKWGCPKQLKESTTIK